MAAMSRTGPNPETRRRILDGAAAIINRSPIREVSVKHVLEEAGISRRTFYQYFRSLDAVVLALYEEASERLYTDLVAAVSSTNVTPDQVRLALNAYLDQEIQGGPVLYRLQAEAMHAGSPLHTVRERTFDLMSAYISEAVKNSTGKWVDSLVFRALLLGMEGVILHLQRDATFTQEDADYVKTQMWPFVIAILHSVNYLAPAKEA